MLFRSLIDDILELSQVAADRLPVDRHDHPLQPIIDEVLATARAPAIHKGLRLEVEHRGPMPETIHTDLGRLRQILVNLVSNAIKFTERGEVRLTLRSLPAGDGTKRLQFAVSDTGVGIPTAKIGELFQAFV